MSERFDLGPLASIPVGEGRTFAIGEHRVAVFRTRGGEVYATDAACPHKGGPLADGIVGDGCVVCPLHGMKFELATGAARGHLCGDVATYPVSVAEDGRIHLRLTRSEVA